MIKLPALFSHGYENKSLFQFFKHLFVGGGGVILNYLSFLLLLKATNLALFQITVLTHIFLIFYSFFFQKYFTYMRMGDVVHQYLKFLSFSLSYFAADFILTWFFIDSVGLIGWHGKAIALLVLTPASFCIQKYWVFNGRNW
jgi:putative flippase GtrA